MAPTVLNLFGVEIPSHMKGRPLIGDSDGHETFQPEEKEKWAAPGQRGQAA
jgi:hypothetical protein